MQNITNTILVVIILALVGWIIIKPQDAKLSNIQEPSPMPSSSSKQYVQAEQVIKPGKSYTAIIKTSVGDITVELSKDTPVTTNNFVFLAQEKFYDGVIFHRVIPGFMIQGGDPTGTGLGDPGYKFNDEIIGEQKFNRPYLLAMANSGKGTNTNGSQFFITVSNPDWLNGVHTIFGEVTIGKNVVDKIANGKTGPSDRPIEPVSIKSIEITEE